jgi:hypothetical protein
LDDYGKFESGNKLTYQDFQKYMDSMNIKCDIVKDIVPKWFYPILLFGSLITKIVSNSSLPTDIPISIVGNENKGMMASPLTKKILKYDGVKFEKFI